MWTGFRFYGDGTGGSPPYPFENTDEEYESWLRRVGHDKDSWAIHYQTDTCTLAGFTTGMPIHRAEIIVWLKH